MQIDIEVINDMLMAQDDMFEIIELNTPRQGGHSKDDRIERLEPDIRGGRFHLPCIVHHPEMALQDRRVRRPVLLVGVGRGRRARTLSASGKQPIPCRPDHLSAQFAD